MIKFLSVGQKIFILLAVLLLIILAVVGAITYTETAVSQARQEQRYLDIHRSEFSVIKDLHTRNISVLVESEIEQSQRSVDNLRSALDKQLTFWQINELISDIWVINNRGDFVYRSRSDILPFPILDKDSQRLLQFEPKIWCEYDCYLYVGVPFVDENRNGHMVYVSQTLTKMMADIYLTTGASISQVRFVTDKNLGNQLAYHSETSDSVKKLFAPFIKKITKISPDNLQKNGATIEHNKQAYFMSFVNINPEQDASAQFLAFLQDVDVESHHRKMFALNIFVTAMIVLVLFSLVFYSFTAKYRRRMANLVERFPLLKENNVQAFSNQRLQHKRTFADEIDILDDAAMDLAQELDTIHKKIQDDQNSLRKLAMFDELTQLANRNKLNDFLRDAISRLRRNKKAFGVILIDLDDFKKINDGQGHTIGDTLLQEVADRLRTIVREVDLVCRFGGDEFVIVVDDVGHLREANIIADKVLSVFDAPFVINELNFHVSVSLGMTICHENVLNAEEVIRQADTAMYRAKEVKGNSKRLYDSILNSEVIRKIELEREAREALDNDDFSLALQPLIRMRDNHLLGFEALLRWRHPEKGLISPAEFIPILENSTFMLNLDYYVLERSMKVIQQLDNYGFTEQIVAINLSAMQFLDPKLEPFLKSILQRYDVDPARIELELTEHTLVSDVKRTSSVMRDLRKVGVNISIDDFGTGYSSLSYLSSMPVSKIKIDRSFIKGMLENETDEQIVTSTIAMVRNIGMSVVAEGVETIDQYKFLRNISCDYVQGFLIAKPIPEHQLDSALHQIIDDEKWVSPMPDDSTYNYLS